MFINNRVILKTGSTLRDVSAVLSDLQEGELPLTITAATDALYVGSDMPFNHRFFMPDTDALNAVVCALSVSIWDGNAWNAADDVQDFTSVAGVPFAQAGLLRFALPRNAAWGRIYDSSDIPELSTVKSKARYWAKIQFSANIAFTLRYIGFRFARDADLRTHYRDLLSPAMMQAFNGGEAMEDWDEVHVVAAEEIIRDLRAQEIIFSANQILDPETFTDSACHKLGEIAFKQLRVEDRKEDAAKDYKASMAKRVYNVDRSGNGRLEPVESVVSYRLRRE